MGDDWVDEAVNRMAPFGAHPRRETMASELCRRARELAEALRRDVAVFQDTPVGVVLARALHFVEAFADEPDWPERMTTTELAQAVEAGARIVSVGEAPQEAPMASDDRTAEEIVRDGELLLSQLRGEDAGEDVVSVLMWVERCLAHLRAPAPTLPSVDDDLAESIERLRHHAMWYAKESRHRRDVLAVCDAALSPTKETPDVE